MRLEVRPYAGDAASAAAWDALVAGSPQGTFMHTRRFLAYHGPRFADASVEVLDGAGGLLGVLPAAVDPRDATRVVSHPGATYGGIVHGGVLAGGAMVEALAAVAAHYRACGFASLRYKAVPHIYHAEPAADDTYALFRLGAVRDRCDLSSTIDLEHRRAPSARRRRALRQALRAGVDLAEGPDLLPAVWDVVVENLARKHGRPPVHTLTEMTALQRWFPQTIHVRAALVGGAVGAGVVLYHVGRTVHAQYIARRYGAGRGALDLLIEHAVDEAKRWGARYFDFGISTEDEGRVLNAGLHRFKWEFGAGSVPYEFYTLALDGGRAAAAGAER